MMDRYSQNKKRKLIDIGFFLFGFQRMFWLGFSSDIRMIDINQSTSETKIYQQQ
jgi:hypothetical protein